MHYDYVVTLKRDHAGKTDLISFLLIILSILAFCFAQVRNAFSGFLTIATLILLLGLCVNMYASKNGKVLRFRNWLLAAALFWLGMPWMQWMFIPFIFFALMEAQAKYPLEVGFSSEGVVLNAIFRKKYPWSTLQSVILKDGMLTLDFCNNTLIQKEVLDDDEPEAQEDEFNAYCQGKLVISR